MPKTHQAITLDGELLQALDEFVASRPRNEHAQAMDAALAEKMSRLARMLLAHAGATRMPKSPATSDEDLADSRARLARECAKLDPAEERAMAEEALAADGETLGPAGYESAAQPTGCLALDDPDGSL